MTATRHFKSATASGERLPDLRKALLDEAATLFLSGEADCARRMLCGLVQSSIGFDTLAALTRKSSKSLQRMLSPAGNPSMDNLATIFGAIRSGLNVRFDVRVVDSSRRRRAVPAHRHAHPAAAALTSAP